MDTPPGSIPPVGGQTHLPADSMTEDRGQANKDQTTEEK